LKKTIILMTVVLLAVGLAFSEKSGKAKKGVIRIKKPGEAVIIHRGAVIGEYPAGTEFTILEGPAQFFINGMRVTLARGAEIDLFSDSAVIEINDMEISVVRGANINVTTIEETGAVNITVGDRNNGIVTVKSGGTSIELERSEEINVTSTENKLQIEVIQGEVTVIDEEGAQTVSEGEILEQETGGENGGKGGSDSEEIFDDEDEGDEDEDEDDSSEDEQDEIIEEEASPFQP
jgi:hypothetical protein